jgi:hypothetical protein
VNQSEGGEQGAHGASPGWFYNGPRREIGRSMPTGGIRGAGLVWAIMTIKFEVNSLNGYSIEFLISFVLKSRRNGRHI